VQLVALNWQTDDEIMAAHRAKFEDNGGCGYLLKPPFLRNSEIWSPLVLPGAAVEGSEGPYFVQIRVISARGLPHPDMIDPFVQIKMHGVPVDTVTTKTRTLHKGGFHPNWSESFHFAITVPELVMIQFSV
jgi:hypothetical protein